MRQTEETASYMLVRANDSSRNTNGNWELQKNSVPRKSHGTLQQNGKHAIYLAKTFFRRQKRGRPSSLTIMVSPWISGRQ